MAYPGIKSSVNQPTRIFISSDDDTTTPNNGAYSQFTVNYITPILGCRKAQLLRCTIPNASATGVTIPNYMLNFWYYQLPTATTTPSTTYLKCVRLYPALPQWTPPSSYTTYSQNRYFQNPSDLVYALNIAAAVGGDNVTYNPSWVSGDISFSFNSTTNQISMTGLTSGKYYAIAGWDDPTIATNAAALSCPISNSLTIPQPYVLNHTLNLRVGYALSGMAPNYQGNTSTNNLYANIGNITYAQNVAIPPDAFPDLVYTQCVYLYSNMCVGSSLTSNGRHNLLSVAPITAGQLVVSQYVALTLNYLLNTPDTIYNITIEMRDDNDQPFYLNDNNTVNIEMALTYTD